MNAQCTNANAMCCPICTDKFKNGEEIYSTNCGHVFHFECLQNWLERSRTCPHCRISNPVAHKIFLNLEENISINHNSQLAQLHSLLEDKNQQIILLQEQHVMKISQLESYLQESEKECSDLQDQVEYFNKQYEQLEQESLYKVVEKEKMELQIQKQKDLVKTSKNEIEFMRRENEKLVMEVVKLRLRLVTARNNGYH